MMLNANESQKSDGEQLGPNPLDALLVEAVSNADPVLRERAYQKLMQRGHLIARRLMGDGVRNMTESMDICLSVIRDLSMRIEQKKVSFDSAPALVAYLRESINSKVNEKVRYSNAEKRRADTIPVGPDAENGEIDPSTGYDETEAGVLGRELQQAHAEIAASERQQLSAEHQLVVEARVQNPDWTWEQVANHMNHTVNCQFPMTAEYSRQIFSRYIKSVRAALNERKLGPGQD